MVLVLAANVTKAGLSAVALVATLVAACDPTYAIALENSSPADVVVARWTDVDVEQPTSVVLAPTSTRTKIGAFGVASTDVLWRITILGQDCEVLSDELIDAAFLEGGLIRVTPSFEVIYQAGGNPPGGDEPSLTERCADEISRLDP